MCVCMIEVRMALKNLSHGSRFTVTLNRQKNAFSFEHNLFGWKQEARKGRREKRRKEKEEDGVNAYNVKRSEPVPLERGSYMRDFLP